MVQTGIYYIARLFNNLAAVSRFMVPILIIAAGLVILTRVGRRIFRRLSLLRKIRAKNPKNIEILNPLFFLSKNDNYKFDLRVETQAEIYYIKLFSLYRKNSQVIFEDAKRYRCRTYFLRAAYYRKSMGIEDYFDIEKLACRSISCGKTEKAEFDGRKVVKVLLFCPVCVYKISTLEKNGACQLWPGEYVEDFLFSNTSYFLNLL